MKTDALKAQIDFIIELDKLKQVFRQTLLIDDCRQENDAEHSWHLALMACLLSEHAREKNFNIFRVVDSAGSWEPQHDHKERVFFL